MNLFFDVDYTILGVDGSLRPGTRETFLKLAEEGHVLYVWSGIGLRNGDIQRHGLDKLVTDVFRKPLEDFERGMQALAIPVCPDLVVDDYPEIVSAFGGILVRPYFFTNSQDREMERIHRIITDYAQTGHSNDPAFRPRQRDVERQPFRP